MKKKEGYCVEIRFTKYDAPLRFFMPKKKAEKFLEDIADAIDKGESIKISGGINAVLNSAHIIVASVEKKDDIHIVRRGINEEGI